MLMFTDDQERNVVGKVERTSYMRSPRFWGLSVFDGRNVVW